MNNAKQLFDDFIKSLQNLRRHFVDAFNQRGLTINEDPEVIFNERGWHLQLDYAFDLNFSSWKKEGNTYRAIRIVFTKTECLVIIKFEPGKTYSKTKKFSKDKLDESEILDLLASFLRAEVNNEKTARQAFIEKFNKAVAA